MKKVTKKNLEACQLIGMVEYIGVNMVSRDPDAHEMWFDATAMAKPFGKQPVHFLKLDSTHEYVAALIKRDSGKGISPFGNSALYSSVDSGTAISQFQNPYVHVQKGGKYQGTWMHQKLALEFARWLSADFRVDLDDWIVAQVRKDKEWLVARDYSRLGYRPMTDATVASRALLEKETLAHHHSNEANLVNLVVLNMTAKEFKALHGVENVRDALSPEQNTLIARVQKANTAFIECGFDYATRKEMLMKTYSPENSVRIGICSK